MDLKEGKHKRKDYKETKRNYNKRFHRVTTRYTPDELKVIDKKMAALGYKTRTEFVKVAAIGSEYDLILKSQIFKTLQYEVRKIGVNLNQIAYGLNSKQPHFNSTELQNQINNLKVLLLKISDK